MGNATQAFSIAVVAADVPPAITTTALPGGTVGKAYNATLTATGTQPITWGIASGALPDGLALEQDAGKITGTPTAQGTARFTVQAQNSVGNATQAFSIAVAAAPAPKPDPPPKTGDSAHPVLWTLLALLSIVGIAALLTRIRKQGLRS